MTPTELIAALEKLDYAITSRRLTDWVSKGLLPPLQQRGRGRHRGAIYIWSEPDIVDQAATIYDLLSLKSRAQPALMAIWFVGYPVEISRIRKAWLSQIREEERGIQRLASKQGDLENLYAPWATRLAKRFSSQWNMEWQNLDEFFLEVLGLILDNNYEFDVQVYYDLFLSVIVTAAKTSPEILGFINSRRELDRWVNEIRTRVTSKARRRFIASVSDSELLRAHSHWQVLGGITRLIWSSAAPEIFTGPGLSTAKRIAMTFGGVGILLLLHIGRSRYSKRVQEILSLAEDLITSHSDDIQINVEDGMFRVENTIAMSKWELLKKQVGDLWTLWFGLEHQ